MNKTIFCLVAVTFLICNCEKNENQANLTVAKVAPTTGNILQYKILKTEDVSYRDTPRIVYRIMIETDSIPKETDIKSTAETIWKEKGEKWVEFTTFFYLPEMPTNSTAYAVGEFRKTGLIDFTIHESSLIGTKWKKENTNNRSDKINNKPLKTKTRTESRKTSIEYKLAAINSNSMNPEQIMVNRFRTYLSILDERFPENKQQIADMTVTVFNKLNDRGKTITLDKLFSLIIKNSSSGTAGVSYAEYCAALLTLL